MKTDMTCTRVYEFSHDWQKRGKLSDWELGWFHPFTLDLHREAGDWFVNISFMGLNFTSYVVCQ